MTVPATKPCDRCGVSKPLDDFISMGREVKTCSTCLEAVRNRKREQKGYTQIDGVWCKVCKDCGQMKAIDEFKNPNNQHSFYNRCTSCREALLPKPIVVETPEPGRKTWAWEKIESPEGIPPYDPQFLGCETEFALREGV